MVGPLLAPLRIISLVNRHERIELEQWVPSVQLVDSMEAALSGEMSFIKNKHFLFIVSIFCLQVNRSNLFFYFLSGPGRFYQFEYADHENHRQKFPVCLEYVGFKV